MLLKYYICFNDKKHEALDIVQTFDWNKHEYDLLVVEGYEHYEDAYEMAEALNLIMKTEIKCPKPPNWGGLDQDQRKSN